MSDQFVGNQPVMNTGQVQHASNVGNGYQVQTVNAPVSDFAQSAIPNADGKSKKQMIFDLIQNYPDGITDRDASETLSFNQAMINQYCRQLAAKGLIRREEVYIDHFTKRTLNFPVKLDGNELPAVQKSEDTSLRWKTTLDYIMNLHAEGKTKDEVLEEALMAYSRELMKK